MLRYLYMPRACKEGLFFIFITSLILLFMAAYYPEYVISYSESYSNKDSHEEPMSRFENICRPAKTANYDNKNENITSINLKAPPVGSLQIPYIGLVTDRISPALAEILDLDNATRAMVVTYVSPGSPGDRNGFKALNISRITNTEEITSTSGNILSIVDDKTIFSTDYDNLEQYIYENKRVGDNITITALQNGQLKDIEMTVEAMPRFLWYENKEQGIKMKYPPDWIVSDNQAVSGKEIVKFLSLEKSALSKVSPAATVSVSRYLSNSTNSSNTIKSSEKGDIGNVRILDTSTTTLDSLHAYCSIYYDFSQKKNVLKVLTVFVVGDSNLYRIDYSADPRKYDDYLTQVSEMITSFKLIKE